MQTEADGNIDVYVPLGKDYPLFLAVPCMLPFIAWVGVLTAILGGAAALVEVDLKRMLA